MRCRRPWTQQPQEFIIKGDFKFLCLLQRLRDRDDDVPEHDRTIVQTFVPQGEGEHIGVFGDPAIPGVEDLHPPAVDEEDAQFGSLQVQMKQGLSEVLFQPLQV